MRRIKGPACTPQGGMLIASGRICCSGQRLAQQGSNSGACAVHTQHGSRQRRASMRKHRVIAPTAMDSGDPELAPAAVNPLPAGSACLPPCGDIGTHASRCGDALRSVEVTLRRACRWTCSADAEKSGTEEHGVVSRLNATFETQQSADMWKRAKSTAGNI